MSLTLEEITAEVPRCPTCGHAGYVVVPKKKAARANLTPSPAASARLTSSKPTGPGAEICRLRRSKRWRSSRRPGAQARPSRSGTNSAIWFQEMTQDGNPATLEALPALRLRP